MVLRSITDGSISGTQTLTIPSTIVGGVLITADGTNNATVSIRKESSTGKEIIDIVTKVPLWIAGPFSLEGASQAHVTVSGTGALAQIYEWVT